MKSRTLQRAILFFFCPPVIATFVLAGCTASKGSRLDPEFGQCLEAGLAAQVIFPDGPADPSPVDGLPGGLAVKIYKKRYLKSLTEEKKEGDDVAGQLKGVD